jgi:hypothetical protein
LQEHDISLEMRYLPSALNLYTDRLSRGHRAFEYFSSLTGVREHWWVGAASEHDMKMAWGKVELLRAPLELLALVPEKVKREEFKGLMLIRGGPIKIGSSNFWFWEWTTE